jgi:hypothetical protein
MVLSALMIGRAPAQRKKNQATFYVYRKSAAQVKTAIRKPAAAPNRASTSAGFSSPRVTGAPRGRFFIDSVAVNWRQMASNGVKLCQLTNFIKKFD